MCVCVCICVCVCLCVCVFVCVCVCVVGVTVREGSQIMSERKALVLVYSWRRSTFCIIK